MCWTDRILSSVSSLSLVVRWLEGGGEAGRRSRERLCSDWMMRLEPRQERSLEQQTSQLAGRAAERPDLPHLFAGLTGQHWVCNVSSGDQTECLQVFPGGQYQVLVCYQRWAGRERKLSHRYHDLGVRTECEQQLFQRRRGQVSKSERT